MAETPLKLIVVAEDETQWRWLKAFDFDAADISPVVFSTVPPPAPGQLPARSVSYRMCSGIGDIALPDFGEVVDGFEGEAAEAAEACLTLADGPLTRLTTTAADLFGISVFSLVSTADQLANLNRRGKQRPDLFFVADSELLTQALSDDRYGSTLIPTGHPGRDLVLREAPADDVDPRFTEERFGDGRAGPRILAAIGRWRTATLPPARPDLSIIVPAYNEADNLELVCNRLLEAFADQPITPEILLIDDVSADDTAAVARRQMWLSPWILAYTKPLPRGMGNAIRFGLDKARAQIIAITMGDGSDEVAKLPEMYHKVRDGEAALAIGSRYRYRRNYQAVPRLYRFWSFCFRLTTRFLIGLRLSDYTNAFRVYDREIFARYGPESGGFEISPEITFKAWFATRKVTEVDVRHLKRASGQSSFSFLRAGPGYGIILFKAFVQRLTGKWFILEW